uniref:NADH-ubiquinone oxidoreductase chain 6 n=1 Tax=Anilany helenae TaxID=508491 RepID=A0A8K1JA72_9NEOB|nr:NADH dehydrogenase subunit 6 [Anilany helenae]
MFEVLLLIGLLAVAVNPSPYYAALGLVVGAGCGCLVLMNSGLTFLSLALFLVYLGGMMVVFGYSAALVGEPYPEGWGSVNVLSYLAVYLIVLLLGWLIFGKKELKGGVVGVWDFNTVSVEWLGVANIFSGGGWVLFIGGWVLMLTLFGVLEVVRGRYGGALRAV